MHFGLFHYNGTMGYEEGFEAFNNGDYRRAAQLLERAATQSGYASDLINHTFTLALYRAREHQRLADVAFRVGSGLVDVDPGSAMDYFQRAVQAGLDPGRVRRIGEVFEEWSGDRVPGKLRGKVTRVAHVVRSMSAGQPISLYMRMLEESLKGQGIESFIFSTEATSSWFWNPAPAAGVEGDFVQRSDRLAEAVREAAVQLVFYHANLSDQIAARVASLHPAPVQVNVNHDAEMDADLFDGFIHLSQNSLERSRFKARPSVWIPSSSDVEERIQSNLFQTRAGLGVDSASTVSASFSGLARDHSGFLKVLVELLKRFPSHFHFFAGASDVRAIRGMLHSEGVLSRLRFLGETVDTTPLLGAIDLLLVPFPDTGGIAVLDVMGAGKPVIAMRHATNIEFNTAAELVGDPLLTPGTGAEYLSAADRLLRDPASRERMGGKSVERFRKEFAPEKLGERYAQFMEQL